MVLDNPYWHAMIGPHRELALGSGKARRYRPRHGPQAALASHDPEAIADLERIVPPGDQVGIVETRRTPPPPGWELAFEIALEQQVWGHTEPSAPSAPVDATPLGPDDVPAMLELAAATEPGPLREGALELGHFLGVWDDGRLVAMAGERAHLEGYREITGVATLPAWRGRGLASALVGTLVERILGEGDAPFLHVVEGNDAAASVYRRLGFETRARLWVSALRRLPE